MFRGHETNCYILTHPPSLRFFHEMETLCVSLIHHGSRCFLKQTIIADRSCFINEVHPVSYVFNMFQRTDLCCVSGLRTRQVLPRYASFSE